MSVPVQVRLDEILLKRLKSLASARGISTADLIRRFIDRGLDLDGALDPIQVAIREARDEFTAAGIRSLEQFSARADEKADRVERFVTQNMQAVMELIESLLNAPSRMPSEKPSASSSTNPFAK